jgi:hypothetical protein
MKQNIPIIVVQLLKRRMESCCKTVEIGAGSTGGSRRRLLKNLTWWQAENVSGDPVIDTTSGTARIF